MQFTNQIPAIKNLVRKAYPEGIGFFKAFIPNESWLRSKQEKALQYIKEGFWGTIEQTAGFKNPINIDVDSLLKLEGVEGEHEGITKDNEKVLRLSEDMKEDGYIGDAIMVWADISQRVRIAEGNHRVRAAKLAGLPSIPVDFRYYDGAEDILEEQNSEWSPSKIVNKIK